MVSISDKDIEKFRQYLYEEEKSDNTVLKYLRDIKNFKFWVADKPIDKKIVLKYKQMLCEKYAPRSINSMLSSLNSMFQFMNRNDLKVKTLTIQRQIFAKKERKLTKSDYENLLTVAAKKKDKKLYYLMQTMACTGIRISELKYITYEAIKNGETVIRCKGKLRKIFIPKKLCRMLQSYIKQENIKQGPIFLSKKKLPINRSVVWKMLKSLCINANVAKEKVFPHNFRCLFARTYYSMQKDIVRLADILGHSSINTTRIYIMETCDIHKKQIQKMGLLRC